jgi:hypothetical protein
MNHKLWNIASTERYTIVKELGGENASSPEKYAVPATLVTVWGTEVTAKKEGCKKGNGKRKQGLGGGKEYSLSTP